MAGRFVEGCFVEGRFLGVPHEYLSTLALCSSPFDISLILPSETGLNYCFYSRHNLATRPPLFRPGTDRYQVK